MVRLMSQPLRLAHQHRVLDETTTASGSPKPPPPPPRRWAPLSPPPPGTFQASERGRAKSPGLGHAVAGAVHLLRRLRGRRPRWYARFPSSLASDCVSGYTGGRARVCAGEKKALVKAALDGNLRRVKGATPFMTACQSGDVPTVKYLLDRGGDLTKADEKGRTALHHAASTGSCKVTEFLLSQGVPVDIDCGRGTPLYMAATNEQDKTLKILLDHKANVYDLHCFFFSFD
ncbi:hypothetical protein ACQ4PT_058388 [Festuca glaucescens]